MDVAAKKVIEENPTGGKEPVEDELVAAFGGSKGSTTGRTALRFTRTVIVPPFQGTGLGAALNEAVAKHLTLYGTDSRPGAASNFVFLK